MAIQEKAANSRQSVDMKWKLRKALEEQVSGKSDGSGIEFGKDVTVDGKTHVNEFSDIQNAKGEGLAINMFSGLIYPNSSDFQCLICFSAYSLKDAITFGDVFKPGIPVAASGMLAGTGAGGVNKKIIISRVIFHSSGHVYFQGLNPDTFEQVLDWYVNKSEITVAFSRKTPLAKPNPGQWDEEE